METKITQWVRFQHSEELNDEQVWNEFELESYSYLLEFLLKKHIIGKTCRDESPKNKITSFESCSVKLGHNYLSIPSIPRYS